MNPSNYGYENLTIEQVKAELKRVTKEYNKTVRLEQRPRKRPPLEQTAIETKATHLFCKRKTLELILKSKEL